MSATVEPGWLAMKYGTRYCSLPARFDAALEALGELLEGVLRGLLHQRRAPRSETCSGATFRCPPTWWRRELLEVLGRLAREIHADAGGDVHLLHAGHRARRAQQLDRGPVVGAEQLAHRRVDAGEPPAHRLDVGLRAAHPVHVRRRPAEVGDVARRSPASRRARAPRRGSTRAQRDWIARPWCMVIEQNVQPPKQPRMICTESWIVCQAGISRVVARVRPARVRQVVERVHLRFRERQRRRVHHQRPVAVRLR
mgnify:CR=1 FL=1